MTQGRKVSNVGRKAVITEANVPPQLNYALGSTGFYARDVDRRTRWTSLPEASAYDPRERLMAVMVRIENIFPDRVSAYAELGFSRKQTIRILRGEQKLSFRFVGRAAIVADVPYDWITHGNWDDTKSVMMSANLDFGAIHPVLASPRFDGSRTRHVTPGQLAAFRAGLAGQNLSQMSDDATADPEEAVNDTGQKSLPAYVAPRKDVSTGNVVSNQPVDAESGSTEASGSHFPPDSRSWEELPDIVAIPFYEVRASAGPGSMAISEPVRSVRLDRWVLKAIGISPANAAILTAHGDSGLPNIANGDAILIDRSLSYLRDGGLYVIGVDEDVLVKRVQRQADRSVLLMSDNPAYPPQHVSAADAERLRVIGRVRWALHQL